MSYLYTLSAALWYETLFYGSETLHSDRIYISNVQRRGFSLIDQKLSKLRGLNEFEVGLILDISTAQNDNLMINCDVVRTSLFGRICKGNVVKKTL